jgi:mannose/cellobiose epimerase-like protein (N-acyl-D-glucosamine 2-epimerase family)
MSHRVRLTEHAAELVTFARAARHPLGFGWLDDEGRLTPDHPVELWITCRMTHVFGLAAIRGDDASRIELEHGVAALLGPLRDDESGGWFAAVDESGPTDPTKAAYAHAFVVLAAATATAAGAGRGQQLLQEALDVFDRHFWSETEGMVVELWDRQWREPEAYRGVNATMHSVEAMLAAHDVTGDPRRLEMARRMVERVVHEFAAENGYRLCEHFTQAWVPDPDYHRDEPAHPFRPYGVTIGHLLEWARLTLQTGLALGDAAPAWVLPDARALFTRAVADGWAVDGAEGFVYTTDFAGVPVVHQRMHWVVAEAQATAWVLSEITGEEEYAAWYRTWWDHAERLFIEGGSWRHELDPTNHPAGEVWVGRPDTYHAYQATITPLLPLSSSFVAGVRAETGAAS